MLNFLLWNIRRVSMTMVYAGIKKKLNALLITQVSEESDKN